MDLRTIQAGGGGWLGACVRPPLALGALGWGGVQALKALAYRTGLRRATRLPVPVISVGNLVAGGTGKTPFTAWLVAHLRARGHRPGVLSRGYGPRVRGGLSDEGAVLAHALGGGASGSGLPQVEDPDRVRGGRRLLRAFPDVDVLVLDDGFQHRRVHRDLDLVLLDASRPLGFGRLLPRGLLRERPGALGRAAAVVLTRVERVAPEEVERVRAEVGRWTPAPVLLAATEPVGLEAGGETLAPLRLAGERIVAVSGLGDPSAFEDTLTRLGAVVLFHRRLGDHAGLSTPAWADVLAEAGRLGAARVVITRKDAVKVPTLDPRVSVLDVALRLTEGEDRLDALVAGVLAPPR